MRSIKTMLGCGVEAIDGSSGSFFDCYFDDQQWAIRHMVVQTGSWWSTRRVLIEPSLIQPPNTDVSRLPVALSRDQVACCPHADTAMPVSRCHEVEAERKCRWAFTVPPETAYPWHFGITGSWLQDPVALENPEESDASIPWSPPHEKGDQHLRSVREILGYKLHREDGNGGIVTDFLVDDQHWMMAYLLVRTGGWLMPDYVLLPTEIICDISWARETVYMGWPPLERATRRPHGYQTSRIASLATASPGEKAANANSKWRKESG